METTTTKEIKEILDVLPLMNVNPDGDTAVKETITVVKDVKVVHVKEVKPNQFQSQLLHQSQSQSQLLNNNPTPDVLKVTNANPNGDTAVKVLTSVVKDVKEVLALETTTTKDNKAVLMIVLLLVNANLDGDIVDLVLSTVMAKDLKGNLNLLV